VDKIKTYKSQKVPPQNELGLTGRFRLGNEIASLDVVRSQLGHATHLHYCFSKSVRNSVAFVQSARLIIGPADGVMVTLCFSVLSLQLQCPFYLQPNCWLG
jgi:hypothetical protein